MSLPQDPNRPVSVNQPAPSSPSATGKEASRAAWGVLILKGPAYMIYSVDVLILEMWGRTEPQVLGKPLYEALPELRGQGFEELLQGVYTTGVPFMGKEVLGELERNGRREKLYFDFIYLPIRDEHETITGITVVATDATAQVLARQTAEQALRVSQQRERAAHALAEQQRDRLYSLFMQAPIGIGIYGGKEHTIRLVNPFMCQMLGRQADELLGKPLFEALPEVRGQGFEQILGDVFSLGKPFEAKEIPATVVREGALHHGFFNTHYQPLWNLDQEVDGIIQFVVEVTEQVLAYRKVEESEEALQILTQELATANEELAVTSEELQASNEELLSNNDQLSVANEQLNKVNVDLDNFVYAASHDLKSPVNSLQGLLALLTKRMDGRLDEKGNQIMELIQESVQRLSRTIQDLALVGKVQRNKQEEKETIYFAGIMEDVEADLQELIEASGVDIKTDFQVEAVLYPRQSVRSILYNLLSNAIKYRSPDRSAQVVITTRQVEDQTVLTVQDNGLGLTSSQQQSLFSMFKRFHNHVDGSGIGLYMIKRMLENNGSTIAVESKVSEGSTFTVYF